MSHPAWSLIKFFYCLDTDTSIGRWDKCVDEFEKVGITYVERLLGTEEENRYLSFNKAHYGAIKKGYETGDPFCVFENDIVFDNNWKRIEEATAQLPKDWDLLYLGANITGYPGADWQMPQRVSGNILRLYNAWQTHAIVYSNKMAKWVLDNFDPNTFPVYDEWLRVNVMAQFDVYLISPMICYQRPGYSVLNRSEVAYGCHKEGLDWIKENL